MEYGDLECGKLEKNAYVGKRNASTPMQRGRGVMELDNFQKDTSIEGPQACCHVGSRRVKLWLRY